MRILAHAVATGALLTPETQRKRLDTTVPMNPQGTAFYGLGIFNAGGWIGHSGSIFGYQTVALYLPQMQTRSCISSTPTCHTRPAPHLRAITSVISPTTFTADIWPRGGLPTLGSMNTQTGSARRVGSPCPRRVTVSPKFQWLRSLSLALDTVSEDASR